MKRLVFISFVALSMAASSAMAQQGDVKFFGNVSATTCNLTPGVAGSVVDTIQLGTVGTNNPGTGVPFSLKATNPGAGGCSQLSSKTASVAWGGPLSTRGFENQGGLATGAYVTVKGVNSKVPNQVVNSSRSTIDFDAGKLATDGLQFEATLTGGSTAGDFRSAATYAVTYH
ncbi:TPA: fimbrial protein [Escherichia coli]|nr:fimbrial protein [Escherichia coli]